MTRSLEDIVSDILEAAERIGELVSQGKSVFMGNWEKSSAAAYELQKIGEAARQLPPGDRQRFPDVPWQDMIDMRHVFAHKYFQLDLELMWTNMSVSVPALVVALSTGPDHSGTDDAR